MAQLHLIKQSQGLLILPRRRPANFYNQNASSAPFWRPTLNLSVIRRFIAVTLLYSISVLNIGNLPAGRFRLMSAGLSQVTPNSLLHMAGVNRRYLMPPAISRPNSREAIRLYQYLQIFRCLRAWVIVEAGHYDAIQLPDGTLKNTLAAFLSQAWTNASSGTVQSIARCSLAVDPLVRSTACRKLRTPQTSF